MLIRKATETIQTNQIGEAEKIIELRGRIEKIRIVHSTEEVPPDVNIQVIIETSENEKVLELSGNKNETYYPRTTAHTMTGMPFTYDGNNPVPAKFYAHEFLRITVKSPDKNTKIQEISVFYEETEASEPFEEEEEQEEQDTNI